MKNEYRVTKALMQSWAKEFHLRGASNIVLFALWCLVGLGGLGILLITVLTKQRDWFNYYVSGLFLVLSIYKLFFSRFAIMASRYRLLAKTYGVTEWTRSIEFLEDELLLCDHTSTVRYSYEQIADFKEKRDCVLITFKNRTEARLYKNAFVEGDWQSCRELLEGKMKK